MNPPAPKRHRQNLGYALGISVGLTCLGVFLWPSQERLHALGPMNTGHEDFQCESCHKHAPGSTRQQLQATVRYWLGLRETPVDFGHQDVTNAVCLDCHDRPKDRHPVYRFLEPRFAKARNRIAPQHCVSCHREHQGQRVTLADTGYCATCHEDTQLKRDPIDVPHSRLIGEKRWETCLGCHDFHGNHVMQPPQVVQEAWTPEQIRRYFAGGPSPYPKKRYYQAKQETRDDH